LNRVDETVVFHPLSTAQLVTIVDIQLTRLEERLAERRISLELTAQVKADLAQRGYDPVYGARPLKRLIQQDLETPIAYVLVKGELRDGGTAHVELKDGKIVVTAIDA
jgi:ATP-dependent Clp protease ATP-binding subunit ClpB